MHLGYTLHFEIPGKWQSNWYRITINEISNVQCTYNHYGNILKMFHIVDVKQGNYWFFHDVCFFCVRVLHFVRKDCSHYHSHMRFLIGNVVKSGLWDGHFSKFPIVFLMVAKN